MRLSYVLIYAIPQGKDTALRCRFRCQNYLSLSWDFFRVLCCLPSACNCRSLSRTLSFSGGLLGFSFSLTCCSHLARSRLYCSTTPSIFRKVSINACTSGYGAGVTPLLDSEGKVIVTK